VVRPAGRGNDAAAMSFENAAIALGAIAGAILCHAFDPDGDRSDEAVP